MLLWLFYMILELLMCLIILSIVNFHYLLGMGLSAVSWILLEYLKPKLTSTVHAFLISKFLWNSWVNGNKQWAHLNVNFVVCLQKLLQSKAASEALFHRETLLCVQVFPMFSVNKLRCTNSLRCKKYTKVKGHSTKKKNLDLFSLLTGFHCFWYVWRKYWFLQQYAPPNSS